MQESIRQMGLALEKDYTGKCPVFIGVLNGCFMFFSDLLKSFSPECEVAFIKAASYEGMKSTGNVKFHEAGKLDLEGRDIILIEDIIDTGNTLKALYEHFDSRGVNSIKICTLLFKKEAYKLNLPIDYVCFEVENKFLLGYGLDYDGIGRNLPEIYILNENHD